MPAASNIVINDGQATPVAHTFTVITPQNGTNAAEYRDLSEPIRERQRSILMTLFRAKGKSTRDKVRVVLTSPVLRTGTDGITRVVDYLTTRMEYTIPAGTIQAERDDMFHLSRNLAVTPALGYMVKDQVPNW